MREFSDLAVQDLRRKAAQAYQSALPMTDPKRRAEYLRQAKPASRCTRFFPDAARNADRT